MMNERKIRLIEMLLKHLEDGDAEGLRGEMEPPKMEKVSEDMPKVGVAKIEVEPSEGDAGPMEKLVAEKEMPGDEDEMDDDEFEEMMKMSH